MIQTVGVVANLGKSKSGLPIGYRVLSLDGTEYSAFTTTNVNENPPSSGIYEVTNGVNAPISGGYIVFGTAATDYVSTVIEAISPSSIVPAECQLGATRTGLDIGYRILNLDRTEYSAFTTANVIETAISGTYRVINGASVPTDGFYIVFGTLSVDIVETTHLSGGRCSGIYQDILTFTITEDALSFTVEEDEMQFDAENNTLSFDVAEDALSFTITEDALSFTIEECD